MYEFFWIVVRAILTACLTGAYNSTYFTVLNYYCAWLIIVAPAIAEHEHDEEILRKRANDRHYNRRKHYSDWTAHSAAKKNTYGHKGIYNHPGKIKGQTNPGSLAWDLG